MSMTLRWLATPLPCALLLTLANTFKPLVIDDTAYMLFARHLADDPLHPYGPPPRGFLVIWYQEAQGAFTLLTPPVLPYYLALELKLFGDEPFLWKLGLFPFCWLFTSGLFALFRRFAGGREHALLALTVFSPTFLPSLNLMLDLPAAALGVAAVALFIRAVEPARRRPDGSWPAGGAGAHHVAWGLVGMAGLLAGLGMQTKYTAATAPALIAWYALLHRRLLPALVVAAVAVAVFAGWECFIAAEYGQSHFLYHLGRRYGPPPPEPPANDFLPPPDEPYPWSLRLHDKLRLLPPLFGYIGGLAPAVTLLLGLAFGLPRAVLRAGAAFVCIGFAAVALVPNHWAVLIPGAEPGSERLSINGIVVATNGAAFLLAAGAAAGRLGFRRRNGHLERRPSADGWTVVGWFLIELAGYFAMSPFGAARRVMGLVVTATLLGGHLLARRWPRPGDGRALGCVMALGVALGVTVWAVDLADATVEEQAARACSRWVRAQPGGHRTAWFTGHWGFRFYAERDGMRPVYPGRSVLAAGDWLVVPDPELRPYGQRLDLDPNAVEPCHREEWRLPVPVRTVADYYAGSTPFRKHEGARLRVTIYRVRQTFLAVTP